MPDKRGKTPRGHVRRDFGVDRQNPEIFRCVDAQRSQSRRRLSCLFPQLYDVVPDCPYICMRLVLHRDVAPQPRTAGLKGGGGGEEHNQGCKKTNI